MGVLTLVRHAQASFHAADYDELSALGREQARLLGEFWARRRISFDEVYCGPRVRQRHTAEIVGSVITGAGKNWPELVVLPELDEYDLVSLLRHLAPELARQDVAFAELLAAHHRDADGPDQMRSFQRVFEALTMHWATTAHTVAGAEAFTAFRERVRRGLRRVTEGQRSGRRVAVFTSGGVIGTVVGLALNAPDRTALELNWRVRNCSLTEFVFTKNRISLDSFNALPHLEDSSLWTYW
ncbi:MAG TPA: histidine phosphatase family protein [Gemmata sp.]|nr:histidine phosphatase family protein [Gemmata sp.]